MKSTPLVILLILSTVGTVVFKPQTVNFGQERPLVLLFPPKELRYFTLGFQEIVSDFLWIRVIQNFDLCERQVAKNSKLSEKTDEGAKEISSPQVGQDSSVDSILDGDVTVGRCEHGWVYQMIDTITDLTPKFRIAYSAGASMLSVIVEDPKGAADIYEKALAYFPSDWPLAYSAGAHFLYSMKDSKKAGELFDRAARNGAPEWTHMLAATLFSRAGQLAMAHATLKKLLTDYPNLAENPRVIKRLKAVEADMAKLKEENQKTQH